MLIILLALTSTVSAQGRIDFLTLGSEDPTQAIPLRAVTLLPENLVADVETVLLHMERAGCRLQRNNGCVSEWICPEGKGAEALDSLHKLLPFTDDRSTPGSDYHIKRGNDIALMAERLDAGVRELGPSPAARLSCAYATHRRDVYRRIASEYERALQSERISVALEPHRETREMASESRKICNDAAGRHKKDYPVAAARREAAPEDGCTKGMAPGTWEKEFGYCEGSPPWTAYSLRTKQEGLSWTIRNRILSFSNVTQEQGCGTFAGAGIQQDCPRGEYIRVSVPEEHLTAVRSLLDEYGTVTSARLEKSWVDNFHIQSGGANSPGFDRVKALNAESESLSLLDGDAIIVRELVEDALLRRNKRRNYGIPLAVQICPILDTAR